MKALSPGFEGYLSLKTGIERSSFEIIVKVKVLNLKGYTDLKLKPKGFSDLSFSEYDGSDDSDDTNDTDDTDDTDGTDDTDATDDTDGIDDTDDADDCDDTDATDTETVFNGRLLQTGECLTGWASQVPSLHSHSCSRRSPGGDPAPGPVSFSFTQIFCLKCPQFPSPPAPSFSTIYTSFPSPPSSFSNTPSSPQVA